MLFVNLTPLLEAGPVGLLYGFIFAWLGSLAAAASLGELSSIAPVSAGQYFWTALLAPPSCRKFLTWLTGWMTLIGWFAVSVPCSARSQARRHVTDRSQGFSSALQLTTSVLQTLIQVNHADTYVPQMWHVTLLMWALSLVCFIVNTVLVRGLHFFELLALGLHFTVFIGILAALAIYAPRTTASFVFTDFEISSGWANAGTAWMIGSVSSVYAFLGYDGPCHLAEESRSASTAVANSMLAGVVANGLMGIGFAIAFLYNIESLSDTLNYPGYDFVYIFANTTGSTAAATAMSSFIVFFGFTACVGFLAGGSRVAWSFARDNGFPFSHFFTRLQQPAAYPLRAIVLMVVVADLLALIQVGSSTAFNAFISISISGIQIANAIPITLLISKKLAGTAPQGPWSMGRAGLAVNIFAVAFLITTTIFSFFPTLLPITLVNFNWSCVVFGSAVIFGLGYYMVWGRSVFCGPIVEVDDQCVREKQR